MTLQELFKKETGHDAILYTLTTIQDDTYNKLYSDEYVRWLENKCNEMIEGFSELEKFLLDKKEELEKEK